eukprot:gi/632962467/ref/XP_007897329.1/ PREDICTED: serine/arginine repetitive matrix protein 4 [Callorhinchus milii]
MASVHQGEKQLFEKFWRGTFKAVASPRQESIIVASITARKTLSNDTSSYQSYREPRTDEQRTEKPSAILATTGINGYSKAKENRHQNHHRVCRSCHSARSPLPPSRGKKKKKKSEHKRKRSPSYSPAPARKKKKKSSKKHKRNRSDSASTKKRRHSSASPRRKRKEEKRHRRRSWSGSPSRKAHRGRRSITRSSGSSCSSSNEGRSGPGRDLRGRSRSSSPRVCSKANDKQVVYGKGRASSAGSPCKSPRNKPGKSADKIVWKAQDEALTKDYDSGNDTSSPPSAKAAAVRSQAAGEAKSQQPSQGTPSPEKLKFSDLEHGSDSGNSVTSYPSPCKGAPSPPNASPAYQLDKGVSRELPSTHDWCATSDERKRSLSPSPGRHRSRSDSRSTGHPTTSRSSSRSSRSRSPAYTPTTKYSRSRSHSSGKSYERRSCHRQRALLETGTETAGLVIASHSQLKANSNAVENH